MTMILGLGPSPLGHRKHSHSYSYRNYNNNEKLSGKKGQQKAFFGNIWPKINPQL